MKTTFETCLKLHLAGDLINAELCYRQLLKNKNKVTSDIYYNLGIICTKTERDDEAIVLFKKIINLHPNSSLAYNNLGLIYFKKQKFDDAINNFLFAVKYKKNSKTFFYLAITYEKIGKFKKAVENYKQAINLDKNDAGALCNLGQLYLTIGNLEEAKKYISLSIKAEPNLDASFNNLGLINMALGKFNLAKKNFKEAIKINYKNSKAHLNLSNLINYKTNGIEHLKQMLQNFKLTKSNNDIINYCFALGKVYEDKKNYKNSFKYFEKGNLITRKKFTYSILKDKNLFKNLKKIFNIKLIQEFKNIGFKDKTPIFILGMPRSGTSLVEQILASHPDVFGAGEINDLDDIILNFFCEKKEIKNLKKTYSLNKNIFKSAGRAYSVKLKKRSNSFKFITNKLPLNFRWIGFINLILPNAKIIHCKRQPIDTLLSIYQKNFLIRGNEYSFNLKEITQYFIMYMDLMVYWKNLIPNSFYDINYENLIFEQKNQTRKLLNYCNLPWNNKCLNFSKTNRIVRTSSDIQVRKKIYKNSINKWILHKQKLVKYKKIIESTTSYKKYYS